MTGGGGIFGTGGTGFTRGAFGIVRTSGGGGFVPSDVAGHSLQLKASSLALSNLDPVAAWNDSSGNGVNFAQGVAGSQPSYQSGGGSPFVHFDGVDDYLTAGDKMDLGLNSLSVFIIARRTALAGTFISKTAAGGQGRWGWIYNAGDSLYGGVYQDNASLKINDNPASDDVDAAFVLYELHIDRVNGSMKLYRDEVLENDKTLSPDSTDSINNTNDLNLGIYIPGAYPVPLQGDIKHVDAFLNTNIVTGTDLTNLRSYYSSTYNL